MAVCGLSLVDLKHSSGFSLSSIPARIVEEEDGRPGAGILSRPAGTEALTLVFQVVWG